MERPKARQAVRLRRKTKRMRGRKKREREEPDLKRREEVKVAIVMDICCKAKMGRG